MQSRRFYESLTSIHLLHQQELMSGRIFLILPDLLVYLSIAGFGYLMGLFTVLIVVVYFIMNNHTITIKKENTDEINAYNDLY